MFESMLGWCFPNKVDGVNIDKELECSIAGQMIKPSLI